MNTASPEKPSAKTNLVLVDFDSHTRGGHFAHWLKFFCIEFARRFERVACYTPDPALTRKVFTEAGDGIPANADFFPLPRMLWRKQILFGRRRKCTLQKVLADHKRRFPGVPRAAFIMWSLDLLDDVVAETEEAAPWGVLSCLSWDTRGYDNQSSREDGFIKKFCIPRKDCVFMLTPDNFIADLGIPKTGWVNCSEDLRLPEGEMEEASALKKLSAGRPVIGSIGMQTGPRCVDEMLRLAARNPEIVFMLAGKFQRQTINPELLPLLEERRPENVVLFPGFFPERKLNAFVKSCDALFVDGLNYPVHSSVACKALHFGKFLLSRESNSWVCDAISQWGVGISYKDGQMDLKAALESWKASGGEERARKAAEEFMGEKAVRETFDRISADLARAAVK